MLLLHIVGIINTKAPTNRAEAWARRHREEEPLALFRVPHGPEEAEKAPGAQEITDLDASLGGRFEEVGQDAEVGGSGQDQRIRGHEIPGRGRCERTFHVAHDVSVGSHGTSDPPRLQVDSSTYR